MALRLIAAVGAVGVTVCCATASTSTTRELPLGLGSLGTQLDGCEPDAGDDGIVRMRCASSVVLAVKNRKAGTAAEPQYKAEAYGMAQQAAARLVWDQIVVPTEGPSGLVDRARALEPGSDAMKGTLLGAVRSLHKDDVQEVWCSAPDDAGVERCKNLLGGFLGTGLGEPPPPPPPTATTTTTTTAASTTTPATTGPVTMFGRALSLPTSCKVHASSDGGDAVCKDGPTLSWRRFDEMDEATQAVQAMLDALGDNGDAETFSCTVAGEVARCEAHERGIAGVTYLDGKPIAVLCTGVTGAREHSVCKALIKAQQ